MDYTADNPILAKATVSADRGPILHSTCSDRQPPKSAPSAGIRKAVAELGLRYQPSAEADLEAHAARLALLATDCAHLPVEALRAAISRWSVSKPFLPKASELIELARQAAAPSPRALNREAVLRERVEFGNAHLRDIGRDHELCWRIENGEAKIGWK